MRRQGFTLVEMMVSLALVLFIMVILTQAFQAGLNSFRILKGVGNMEDNLRSVATILRRDLAADHFEGKRRISDESFWTVGPPREGFFRIWQGSRATPEGIDGDGLPSTRATDHMLQFTVKLRGNQPQDFVSAAGAPPQLTSLPSTFVNSPPDTRYQTGSDYNSQWFEVMYCLRQTGTTALPDNPSGGPGTPLFALIRRQLVVVPNNIQLNSAKLTFSPSDPRSYPDQLVTPYAEVSCKLIPSVARGSIPLLPQYLYSSGSQLYFNNPTDLTVPPRRFGMLPLVSNNNQPTLQHECAGLPSVPLQDPNTLSTSASLNRVRKCPMLGEMVYQTKLYGNVPASQWPSWLQKWWQPGPAYSVRPPDGTNLLGLPPPWQDNPLLQGADVLLTDVVSFEVKVLVPGALAFTELFDSTQVPANNPLFQGNGPRVFDTWSSVKDDTYDYSSWSNPNGPPIIRPPAPIPILALQITLRIWDRTTQQTRQITLVQDM
jgi:prepilin-type N-terminal cleavage/methylation domain-containing protein